MKTASTSAAVLLCAVLTCTTSSAGTLNFNELGQGELDVTAGSVSGAGISSSADTTSLYSGEYFPDAGGSICAAIRTPDTFSCTGDLFIAFTTAVHDLRFQTRGYDVGDDVTISAFAGDVWLGEQDITSDTEVDFSALFGITRLSFIDNNSTGAGYAYGAFSFDTKTVPTAVPEPATWLLVALGLAAVAGTARQHQRR